MADRSVEVRLRADISQFQRAMTQASASAKGLFNNLDTADSKMSNLVQTGLALGPALVPIGAAAVPAIAGLATQLGFAASAAGTTILAFQGVGDALGALNEYQLDPSAANFEKLNEAMATLGPAGQDFVRFLQDIRPQMQGLQDLAQEGLFPGLEDGIGEMLDLMPQAEKHITAVSTALGDLARDAGDNLNDDRWVNFFEYLNAEAGPTLQAMGRSIGNVVEGLANMIVDLDPLTDMFTGGMLQASRDFREWSEELASTEGFQGFIDYIRDNGPQAMETLGAIATAIVALVQAAAPVGAVVLPVLEALANVLTAVASSPAGPVLISAAAGFAAISRAVALYNAANGSALMGLLGGLGGGAGAGAAGAATGLQRMNMAISGLKAGVPIVGALALSMTDLDEKTGLANTAMFTMLGSLAGPWGAAAGGAIGLTMDLAAANDELEAAVQRVDAAFQGDNVGEQEASLEALEQKVQQTKDSYTGLMNAVASKDVVGFFAGLGEGAKSAFLDITGATDQAEEALQNYANAGKRAAGLQDIMAGGIGVASDAFKAATQSAEEFYASLNKVNALLDKRSAFRAARDAVRDFNQTMEDGPKNLRRGTAAWDEASSKLDAIADASLVAAGHLRGMARVNFIDRMRGQFLAAADAMNIPIGQAKRLADRLGLLDKTRAKPQVDANTVAADGKLTATERKLLRLMGLRPVVPVDVDPSGAISGAAAAQRSINGITGKTVQVITEIITKRLPVPSADGNILFFAGGDVADAHQPMLARGGAMRVWNEPETGGEAYIPLRNDGRRPRARGILEETAGLLGGEVMWYARGGRDGGEAGGGGKVGDEAKKAGNGLRELRHRLREATRALEQETKARDRVKEWADSLRTDVMGTFNNDPFGNGLAGFDLQLSADRNDARAMKAAIAAAKKKGLDGSLFSALVSSGDLNTAQQFAGLSRAEIDKREKLFQSAEGARSGLANLAVNTQFGAELRESNKERKQLVKVVNRLENKLDKLEAAVERGARKGVGDKDRKAGQRAKAGR